MSDSFSLSGFSDSDRTGGPGLSSDKSDKELQEFLMIEKQKAQLNAQIHEFSDTCWDMCMDKPSTKLDSRTETCLVNCVDRFIDVSLLVTNRYAQLIQKNAGM
ncbi:mitochondrial import inner membrane translocase subunit Tim8 [Macrosteles quadrilineatus]|uniref:mitochondrial import inner membrane translocase subunit Tim8 n=1 Tax=Macrosteles quadrilineatus TaxID=74068 RepID=UPI0023E2427A|nr:mitochondrial import inner membrane translocase subunit Tim8 [Macrosteles quadrilineatus]